MCQTHQSLLRAIFTSSCLMMIRSPNHAARCRWPALTTSTLSSAQELLVSTDSFFITFIAQMNSVYRKMCYSRFCCQKFNHEINNDPSNENVAVALLALFGPRYITFWPCYIPSISHTPSPALLSVCACVYNSYVEIQVVHIHQQYFCRWSDDLSIVWLQNWSYSI